MTSPPPREPPGAPDPGLGAGPPRSAHARRSWWRSSAGRSALAALAAAALVLAVFLATRGGGGGDTTAEDESPSPVRPRIALQPADAAGPDAFAPGTLRESPPADAPTPTLSPGSSAAYGAPSVSGATRALYGGTQGTSACDIARQTDHLTGSPTKAAAFARAAGTDADGIGRYLKSLTPVLLRVDTRVTDHGFADGSATSFAAVLETGTAVLVDDRGVPRVRCASGNPLSPPKASDGTDHTGPAWPGFRASHVVAVRPAARTHRSFVLYDAERDALFRRPVGTRGTGDSWVS